IIYGVAVLLLSTLAISSLPNPWQLVGAGGVYVVATLGVIIYRTVQAGWASVRRSASIVGLIALGCLLAGWGLSFMHGTLVTNPFFGVLLGLLLAGTGRVLFPTDGPVKSPA
ncbi:MAG TPA: hypothetical protein VNM16_03190, partial [Bacillota bacterium]|nr:hypothetical protein [Bacillota bacterium]